MADTSSDPDRPDHVGVDFWRAFRAFETAMFEAVAHQGFGGITQADSDVLVHIGPDGANMVTIARARGVSKQAMQGQVRSLVKRGYLTIEPDPKDARARIVRLSGHGHAMVRALADVKRDLHSRLENHLGQTGMAHLRRALDKSVTLLTIKEN